MKQYVIDELRLWDYEKIKDYLDKYCKAAGLEGVYWLAVPDDLLTEQQQDHAMCKPFHFGIELEEDKLSCGLLVRSSSNIRCHCIAYANNAQRDWLIETLDTMMEQSGIVI
jgi:hypothetical protein